MQRETTLSGWHLFFLWFGAAVSVAEILTGGLLAGLGWEKGLWAIVLGHAVGTVLLVLAGVIGYRERLPSIRSMRISFGRKGSFVLSAVNVFQLIGWTAVMVLEGGRAVSALTSAVWGFGSQGISSLFIGLLVAVWVCLGVRGFKVLNTAAVFLLLVLTVVLSVVVFSAPMEGVAAQAEASFSFGFELSIIMPLSWFPLIADYTSLARTSRAAWLAPLLGYFTGSTWMYAIGLAGALHSGSADPSTMMLAAGLGMVALAVIGLSTVTTTFLDVFSASESFRNVFSNAGRRVASVFFAALGTLLALVVPMEKYIDFLLLLGSVFAPLIAVFLTDYFLFKVDFRERELNPTALVSLALGFALYHLLSSLDPPFGPTLCTVALTATLHTVLRRASTGKNRRRVH